MVEMGGRFTNEIATGGIHVKNMRANPCPGKISELSAVSQLFK